jgi:hypothetical protein
MRRGGRRGVRRGQRRGGNPSRKGYITPKNETHWGL